MDKIFSGAVAIQDRSEQIRGEVVDLQGDKYYRIENFDSMPDFFMNIVSDTDIWMFISSNGALTAGRRNPDNALFPYYTDDRIHDSRGQTGSFSAFLVEEGGRLNYWEPFSAFCEGIYRIQRNIYKKLSGNELIFEEINEELGLSFRYAWTPSEKFGIIKRSRLINGSGEGCFVRVLDGMKNILPAGANRAVQNEFSTLLDGYKKNELLPESGLGLYSLSSLLTDKAEPAESLRCTTVWSTGVEGDRCILLCEDQLKNFRRGHALETELDIRGRRGAYFLNFELELAAGDEKEWLFAADLNKSAAEAASLEAVIRSTEQLQETLIRECVKSGEHIRALVGASDGLQFCGDRMNAFRHASSTLFNVLRGGIFDDDHRIEREDLKRFIARANKRLSDSYEGQLARLPDSFSFEELLEKFRGAEAGLQKLLHEYLPLTFSRRHGDPSRPWNWFSIDIKDKDGKKILNYQGNWRDIFQNWEALAFSYPEFIENMISKFVNASTADGYNPYRLTRDGFEWEVPEPESAWANIGYWGDHQIIYLLKLLMLSRQYHPEKLSLLLGEEIFSFANVPYRIKTFDELVKDPHDTIAFDQALHERIMAAVEEEGMDAKSLRDDKGDIILVNLAEKLLIPMLVKLSNFVPEAGIWMNTQRPEWNDANNALVGYGASMVTLYYLRAYLVFMKELLQDQGEKLRVSSSTRHLQRELGEVLAEYEDRLSTGITDIDRAAVTERLGQAGSRHRQKIYKGGITSERENLPVQEILDFIALALRYLDHSISANRRSDGLYHAYNLLNFRFNGELGIRTLYEMLEGQVAVLSSGYLGVQEALDLMGAMRKSALYRADQDSYMLYPDRELPRFMEKNTLDEADVGESEYLRAALERGDGALIERDVLGRLRWNADLSNGRVLRRRLEALSGGDGGPDKKEMKIIEEIYEKNFDHQSFTGRSGTFYKYEGLGSIYWHMVSKLRLAVQDVLVAGFDKGEDAAALKNLTKVYYRICEGIGAHKNPADYGAFPIDPYSHTPGGSGVQQPGMTGQTKEDMIARMRELGVFVKDGELHFTSDLLRPEEFLSSDGEFDHYSLSGSRSRLQLKKGEFAFTVCQVPVIFSRSERDRLTVNFEDGFQEIIEGHKLTAEISRKIFRREPGIRSLRLEFANLAE